MPVDGERVTLGLERRDGKILSKNILVDTPRGRLGFGVELPLQGLLEPAILLQSLIALPSASVQAHEVPVRVLVCRFAVHRSLKCCDRQLKLSLFLVPAG